MSGFVLQKPRLKRGDLWESHQISCFWIWNTLPELWFFFYFSFFLRAENAKAWFWIKQPLRAKKNTNNQTKIKNWYEFVKHFYFIYLFIYFSCNTFDVYRVYAFDFLGLAGTRNCITHLWLCCFSIPQWSQTIPGRISCPVISHCIVSDWSRNPETTFSLKQDVVKQIPAKMSYGHWFLILKSYKTSPRLPISGENSMWQIARMSRGGL